MSKKQKSSKPQKAVMRDKFAIENSPFFTPGAFVIIFLALLVLFSSFVFSDKMLYMSDQIQAGVFFRTLLVDYVQETGSIPQWNPYIFGGMPYVEAFHGDIFYPGSFLKYFLSPYRWQGWTLILHIFLAGLFMYFAARQFRLSKTAALLSAVCYGFASYLISLVAPGHDGKVYVTTLFPLVIFFLDRGIASGDFRRAFFNFSMLGLIIGIIILSPHPQMSYFTLWVVGFYLVFKMIVALREHKSIAALVRPTALTGYAVMIGLLISAIQFYPGYSYTTNFSPRSDAKRGWDWATSWSMHEEEAFSLAVPEFAGTTSRTAKTYYWGKNVFKDNSESVGVVSIFVALIGFFFYRRKESYFFGGLALFALIYALGATTPLFKIFYYLIPKVKALRAPSMIMFVFSFSAALLAGMGLQAVRDSRKEIKSTLSKRFNYLLFGFPAAMFLFALLVNFDGRLILDWWSALFYGDAATSYVQQGVSKMDLAYMNLPAIQTGAWAAFFFSGVAALLIWMYRSGKAGVWILAGLVLLPVIDGIRFNKRFVHTVDAKSIWSPNPVTQFFSSRPGQYRVMNFVERYVPDDLLPYFGVEVVVGYHGNQLRWYDNLLGGMAKANQYNPRFLNLVGAEYILLPAEREIPERSFGEKPVTVAADLGPIKIWQNENRLPRAFLVDEYRVIPELDSLRQEVLRGPEDLRKVVYLEQAPQKQFVPDSLSEDSVWVIDYQIDSVLLGVRCSSNKILVLTDNFYESWHAYVDGSRTPVLRADGSFRAVEIPANTSQVLFKFESAKYTMGKWLTGLTSLYLLVIIGLNVYVSRRKGIPERKE